MRVGMGEREGGARGTRGGERGVRGRREREGEERGRREGGRRGRSARRGVSGRKGSAFDLKRRRTREKAVRTESVRRHRISDALKGCEQ
eukprot:67287-Hanusia_phi.AAC.1